MSSYHEQEFGDTRQEILLAIENVSLVEVLSNNESKVLEESGILHIKKYTKNSLQTIKLENEEAAEIFISVGDNWRKQLFRLETPVLLSKNGLIMFSHDDYTKENVGIILPKLLAVSKQRKLLALLTTLSAVKLEEIPKGDISGQTTIVESTILPRKSSDDTLPQSLYSTSRLESFEDTFTIHLEKKTRTARICSNIENVTGKALEKLDKTTHRGSHLLKKGSGTLSRHITPCEDSQAPGNKYLVEGATRALKSLGDKAKPIFRRCVQEPLVRLRCCPLRENPPRRSKTTTSSSDDDDKSESSNEDKAEKVKKVLGTGLKCAGNLYTGLSKSAVVLGHAAAEGTEVVASTKYGDETGLAISNTMRAVGNLGMAIHVFPIFGPTDFLMTAFLDFGVGLMESNDLIHGPSESVLENDPIHGPAKFVEKN